MRVFLAGEGRHELGGWAKEVPYRRPDERGVLEALLRRVREDGWSVAEAICWKKIPKLRVGKGIHGAEVRTVLQLEVLAERAGCDVLVFVRDVDRLLDRAEDVEAAIARISRVRLVGGVAVLTLDAWSLALQGRSGTEEERLPKDVLRGTGCSTTEERVAVVDGADLSRLPEDARSLRTWLDRAATALKG